MKVATDTFFSFALAFYLIVSAQVGVEVPAFLMWAVWILVIISSYLAIRGFGAHVTFWSIALERLDVYGPNRERHDVALEMFDLTNAAVEPYGGPLKFYLSFASSLALMSGLMLQEWYVPLVFEAAASVLGYSFIHYFQVKKYVILEQITGKEAG